jgi:hypothetical protein
MHSRCNIHNEMSMHTMPCPSFSSCKVLQKSLDVKRGCYSTKYTEILSIHLLSLFYCQVLMRYHFQADDGEEWRSRSYKLWRNSERMLKDLHFCKILYLVKNNERYFVILCKYVKIACNITFLLHLFALMWMKSWNSSFELKGEKHLPFFSFAMKHSKVPVSFRAKCNC